MVDGIVREPEGLVATIVDFGYDEWTAGHQVEGFVIPGRLRGQGVLRDVVPMNPTAVEVAILKRSMQLVCSGFVHHLHGAAGGMSVLGGDAGGEDLHFFHRVRTA